MPEPQSAFVSLGSNIEPGRYLPLAAGRLRGLGEVLAASRVYRNPALGSRPQPDYLNAAVLLRTVVAPLRFREQLRRIEADLGRTRTADKYAPRTIDLDLCLYGTVVFDSPELKLPSPDILRRAYLAVVLAELAPDLPHPTTGEPLQAIADRLRPGAELIHEPGVVLIPAEERQSENVRR